LLDFMENIFDYKTYRSYLMERMGGRGKRTGLRSQAAVAIGVHPTFISHVLQEKQNLSLEQADKLNGFLGHSEQEAHFFLLLLQKDRAGSASLRGYFEKQMEAILRGRAILANRVPEKSAISRESEARFYSSWIYGAVHVLLSVPEFQRKENLARHLNLSPAQATEILDFLMGLGLAVQENGLYKMGPAHVHLSSDSENINKHHTNWRIQAIHSLHLRRPHDLHYSAAVTLSRADVEVIRERLLKGMKENLETIKASKEEAAYVYAFDFFELRP
ncbi:MAG: TIGR02147 family protein, partial [Bdellovibrionales bacterium]|nr:TIGR02147 family protein [Bdellovibrionales bacterium]